MRQQPDKALTGRALRKHKKEMEAWREREAAEAALNTDAEDDFAEAAYQAAINNRG